MGKYFNKVMNKMCSYVSVEWEDIDPKKPGWYSEHTWTSKQSNHFREWFIKYLMDNSKARKEIMNYPIKNKKIITLLVDRFMLDYSWKTNG